MPKKNYEDLAYEMIKRQIDNNVWLPDHHLKEVDIAEQLEMSRTPVRKAMARLEKEGYLEIVPYKGAIVSKKDLTTSAIIERLQFIEIMLLKLLQNYQNKETVVRLEDFKHIIDNLELIMEEDKVELYFKTEFELFEMLFSYTPNQYIKQIVLNCVESLHELYLKEIKEAGHFKEHEGHNLILYQRILEAAFNNNYPEARKIVRILINQLILDRLQE